LGQICSVKFGSQEKSYRVSFPFLVSKFNPIPGFVKVMAVRDVIICLRG
jgi:hypothetical protein